MATQAGPFGSLVWARTIAMQNAASKRHVLTCASSFINAPPGCISPSKDIGKTGSGYPANALTATPIGTTGGDTRWGRRGKAAAEAGVHEWASGSVGFRPAIAILHMLRAQHHLRLQAVTQGGEEEAKLQLKLEYMSGPVAEEGSEGSDPPVGRHLLLPVQLRILPSVQVRSIGKTSEIKISFFFRLFHPANPEQQVPQLCIAQYCHDSNCVKQTC